MIGLAAIIGLAAPVGGWMYNKEHGRAEAALTQEMKQTLQDFAHQALNTL